MTTMLDYARETLEMGGYAVNEVRELVTGYGWQLRCGGGEVICSYKSGKVVAQSKNAGAVSALFAAATPPPKPVVVAKTHAVAEADAGDFAPRFPPGWSWEPWDGVTAPF
jgi:ribonuclease HIII